MQFDTVHAVPAICWKAGTITPLAWKTRPRVMSVLQKFPGQCLFVFIKSVPLICGSFAGMSPYDLLARQLVNKLDAVVLSVEWVSSPFHHGNLAKWYVWQLYHFLSLSLFSFWKYFPWLPAPFRSSLCFTQYCVVCLSAFINHRRWWKWGCSRVKLTGFHLGLARIPLLSGIHALLLGHIRLGLRLSVLRRWTAKTFPQQTLPLFVCTV